MVKITTTKGIIFANLALTYSLFFPDSSSEKKSSSDNEDTKLDSKKNRNNSDKKYQYSKNKEDKKTVRVIIKSK